jgi:hypothetical protein
MRTARYTLQQQTNQQASRTTAGKERPPEYGLSFGAGLSLQRAVASSFNVPAISRTYLVQQGLA